jgi:transposase
MEAYSKWELEPGLRAGDFWRGDEGSIVSALGVGTAECPDCHAGSTRRHGWQLRRLQDLPVQGRPVTLLVRVTRWRCQNRRCERQTFTDRLAQAARPLARRTCRVAELARLVGHAAGGLPSERLLTRLGLPQSDDTVLRNLKRHAADRGQTSTARVVGIDDWAWQKGCRYGTIMVDLERREVIDVQSDRSADGARWLHQHPSVEIVSRDRCGLYAHGARRGAPQARQVAGRFHLLQNLRRAIEQQLSRAPRPAKPPAATDAAADACTTVACNRRDPCPELAEHRQLARAGRRALRTSVFDQVKALQARGDDIRAIACRTGLNWRTVEKWSWLEELPPRNVMGPRLTTPSTFGDHLSRRWAEGCTSGRTLLPEIRRLGYAGSFSHPERLLRRWRKAGRSSAADVCTMTAPAETLEAGVSATGHLPSPIARLGQQGAERSKLAFHRLA